MTNAELDAAILAELRYKYVLLCDLGLPVNGPRIGMAGTRLRSLGLVESKRQSDATKPLLWRRVPVADDRPLVDRVIVRATALFGVHRRDILGRYRFDFALHARQAVWLALRRGGLSWGQIGTTFGYHHSTVRSGCRTAEYRCSRDPAYAAKVRDMETLHPSYARRALQAAIADGRGDGSAVEEIWV